MKKVSLDKMHWEERVSPKGRFHVRRKQISIALGNEAHVGVWGGGHPFEAELASIPPGKTNWPKHSHIAQFELYIVVSGRGVLVGNGGQTDIEAGDCFMVEPNCAHSIRNTTDDDLTYFVIADNSPADMLHFSESDAWFAKPLRKKFRMLETEYYEGEEK